MMEGIQNIIYDTLECLCDAVERGDFGEGDSFDRDKFEAAFDDEVLILAYAYDDQIERDEDD
jgi:hypothetical protein